jgi:hypothetical protein
MYRIARAILIISLLSAAAFAEDISGKWAFAVETSAGSGTPSFVFKQAGEKLTGTYNGQFGSAELTGTVKGSDIEFTFEATVGDQKGKVVYKGKIEAAGKMKGTVDYAGLGEGSWTATKQN